MQRFLVGHAAHRDWQIALDVAAAQIDSAYAPGSMPASTLGFVYFTDHYAQHAQALLAALHQRWPDVAWVGTVGVGVSACGIEYFDEPGLVLMLAALPPGHFQVFSGAQPLHGFDAHTALIHADGNTPDLGELIHDMSRRTRSGYLFGGLSASRSMACQIAGEVLQGGLSGVAFGQEVALISRVTQGCQPVGPVRRITACERNVVTGLNGEPALACMLHDIDLTLDDPQRAVRALRGTLVGLSDSRQNAPARSGPPIAPARSGAFGEDVRVRHLIGLDPGQHGVAIADRVENGMQLAFCQRDVDAARRDLVRICTEIREELAPDPLAAGPARDRPASPPADPASRIAGAIYISCAGRGGPHFGAPSAELQIVQHCLGDVPLVGFFAGGEIGHRHLYGYTGVLTVFTVGD